MVLHRDDTLVDLGRVDRVVDEALVDLSLIDLVVDEECVQRLLHVIPQLWCLVQKHSFADDAQTAPVHNLYQQDMVHGNV